MASAGGDSIVGTGRLLPVGSRFKTSGQGFSGRSARTHTHTHIEYAHMTEY